jgi:hypothetical protein
MEVLKADESQQEGHGMWLYSPLATGIMSYSPTLQLVYLFSSLARLAIPHEEATICQEAMEPQA